MHDWFVRNLSWQGSTCNVKFSVSAEAVQDSNVLGIWQASSFKLFCSFSSVTSWALLFSILFQNYLRHKVGVARGGMPSEISKI